MFTSLSTSGKRRSIAFFLAIPLFSFLISQSNIVTKNKISRQPLVECPCTIFTAADVPATPRTNDGTALELGTRFRASQNGFITAIRYYKGSGATGTHLGHLWTSTGQQ